MMRPYTTPSITGMRWLGLAAVGVLLAAIGGILVISAGLTDPTPAALSTRSISLEKITLPAAVSQISWVTATPPEPHLDIRLTAAWAAGDPDAAYGLILGDPSIYLAVAVSPAGYLALWLCENGEEHYLLPWQTWPHVRPGAAGNEIQIEKQGNRIIVRVNREQLWSGLDPTSGAQTGIVAQSFTNPTTIQFERLQLMGKPEGK